MSDLDVLDAPTFLTPKPEEDKSNATGYTKDHQDMMKELSAMNADLNSMVTGVFMQPVNMAVGVVKNGLSSMLSLSDTNTGSPDEHQDKLQAFGDKSNKNNEVVSAVKKVGEFVADNPEVILMA